MNTKSTNPNPVAFAKALADPTRQQIMELTCCTELSVSDIVAAVGVTQPTVSHHLAVLRDAGLVDIRADGKHTYYTINQDRIAFCCGELVQVFAPETETAEVLRESVKNEVI